jgi:hypothetical protein
MAADQGSRDDPPRATPRSGGRTWWAHFEFTRINIAPIILHKKIEDVREAGATLVNAAPFSRPNVRLATNVAFHRAALNR